MRKLVVQVLGGAAVGLVLVLGGNPGTFTAASPTFGVLADSSATGFLRCNENLTTGGQTGNCLLAGMMHTLSFPQTPTGPGPLPPLSPMCVALLGRLVFTTAVGGLAM